VQHQLPAAERNDAGEIEYAHVQFLVGHQMSPDAVPLVVARDRHRGGEYSAARRRVSVP